MPTSRVTQSLSVDNRSIGDVGGNTYTATAGGWLLDGETVATAVTDQLAVAALDVSAVKSFILISDKAISFETNATNHAGGNIITLKANVPYVWNTDSYDTFQLTADVTAIYLTNASGATATVYCWANWDPSP